MNEVQLITETYFANIPKDKLEEYKAQITELTMKYLAFVQDKGIEITESNIDNYKEQIKNYNIDLKEISGASKTENKQAKTDKPCACSRIPDLEMRVNKMQKFGIVALVILVIIVAVK